MIGTDLNLSLPSTLDTYSVAIGKTATALQAIEDSIAQAATPSALNITSNLSFGGNHATNLGGIVLAAGNAPTAAGSVYYSGGNFYMKDATSAIQVTANGALNIAAVGAIGGDYGTGPESFNYDLPSTEFRAMASGSAWADLVCDDVVLMEDSGSEFVRLKSPAALSASYSVEFPAAVPAAQNIVQMTAAGALVVSNTLPEAVTLAVNKSVTTSGTGDYKHGDKTLNVPFNGAAAYTSTGSLSASLSSGAIKYTLTAGGLTYYRVPELRTGWRLKSVTVLGTAASSAAPSIAVQNHLTMPSISVTNSGNLTGGTATCTFDTPYTLADGDTLQVIVPAGASTVEITTIKVVYDIP